MLRMNDRVVSQETVNKRPVMVFLKTIGFFSTVSEVHSLSSQTLPCQYQTLLGNGALRPEWLILAPSGEELRPNCSVQTLYSAWTG